MSPLRFFAFSLLTAAASAAEGDAGALARQVQTLFSAKCSACHQADAPEPKQPAFLDNMALLAEHLDVKKPEDSALYGILQRGEMPKATKAEKLAGTRPTPLNADELAVVLAWTRAGGPAPGGQATAAPKVSEVQLRAPDEPKPATSAPPPGPLPAKRKIVTEAEVIAGAVKDLLSLPAEEQRGTRYLSIHAQHNNIAEINDTDLWLTRCAIRKLLNSLSTDPKIAEFPKVGPEEVLHRIRLRDLGSNWSPELWDKITASYPYALDGQSLKSVAGPAGCAVPVVRADWFGSVVSRPPLYDDILRHPANARDLEKRLGVDVNANLAAGEAIRSAFTKSGISNQNRMVERHEIKTYAGAYWKSYDFKTNAGRGRVVEFPLGPAPANLLGGKLAFQHDGGEIIYNLPNGLQAYLLADGKDNKINEAPVEVVSDRSASRKTSHSQISNGLSCIACHDNGMQPLPPDEVRGLAGTHSAAESRLIEMLFPAAAKMEAAVAADGKRFREAVVKADVDPSAAKEAVQALVNYFEKDVTMAQAAAELGMEAAALEKTLASAPALFSTKQQLGSGRIPRINFADHFTQIAVRLGLGAPRDIAAPSKVLTQIQDPFNVKRDRAAVVAVELKSNATIFKEGDLLTVTVQTNEDAHLRLFARTPAGKLVTLFPNSFSSKTSTLIKANTPVQVPDAAANFELATEGPEFGEETLIAVVSNQPFTDDGALLADVTKSAAKGGFASYGTSDAEEAITKSFRARAKGSRVGVARVKVTTQPKN